MTTSDSSVRINLGCGAIAPSGWQNFDRSPGLLVAKIPGLQAFLGKVGIIPEAQASAQWAKNIRRWDIRKGLPFPSQSVDVIYSSHMLEHLSRAASEGLLRECRRVVAPGGVVRFAVPDLKTLLQTYAESDSPTAAEEFVRESLMGFEEDARGWAKLVAGVSGAHHKWMYDGASLRAALSEANFSETKEWNYREGRCPDLDEVEHRTESVFVEGYA